MGREQATVFAKAEIRHGIVGSLGAQALAALGAAAVDQLAAVFCGHAGAKAMGALALEYAGLKSSFHDGVLYVQRQPIWRLKIEGEF